MILVGFTVPAGERFEIPETGHMAAIGQTQLSGKTTLLEAIAYRGHLKAIAFITKRGEGSFLTARPIQPYFSEPTNDAEKPLWQWVKSILEASQQRRLNFEEAWIIRACEDPRPAKSLADVHDNIKKLLAGEKRLVDRMRRGKKLAKGHKEEWVRKPVTGMNASIYTSLKAYFDIVMPQLARLPYTKRLELKPGLNVMDLREYATETQALVIRSVMEWVYQHETGCRVIVPEAQDFVPQGRNSPVKMACETIVRKGAADRNFMWLDSQDMAAVDKVMLRACSIVFAGVQTEMHEVDRSLASMFTPTLKAQDIASLKIGFFYVRTPDVRGEKVYVQPAWMDSEPHAQAIAKGDLPMESARQMMRAFEKERSPMSMTFLHHEKKAPSVPAPKLEMLQIQTREDEHDPTKADTANRGSGNAVLADSETGATLDSRRAPDARSDAHDENREDHVWKEKYDELKAQYDTLVSTHDAIAAEVKNLRERIARLDSAASGGPHKRSEGTAATVPSALPLNGAAAASKENGHNSGGLPAHDLESIYFYVCERASAEKPALLRVLAERPEIHVETKQRVLKISGDTLDGQIARLVYDGFFAATRNRDAIAGELRARGALSSTANLKVLSPRLAQLTEWGFLRAEPDGYKAVPGMKIHIKETA